MPSRLGKLAAWPVMFLGAAWPATAVAVGLGELIVSSRLNQALDAEIPVLAVAAEDLADIRVDLAPRADFDRAGIPRPHMLQQLRFQLTAGPPGRATVEVTSRRPIREPFLNFLLEVETPRVRLVREYTVLLDPVHYKGERRQARVSPQTARRGPATSPLPAAPPASAPFTTSSAVTSTDERYGPVKAGESISVLGFKLRPDQEVAGAQMALALYRANPEAFLDGDIHSLRAGAVLRVPRKEEALATPYTRALRFVRFGKQGPRAPVTAGAADGASPPAEAERAPAEQISEASPAEGFQLKLLSAEEERPPTHPPVSPREPLPNLDREALPQALREFRGRVRDLTLENQRLSARLAAAEQMLSTLQAQVEARDGELQRLRNKLRRAETGGPSASSETPAIALPATAGLLEQDTPVQAAPVERQADGSSLVSLAAQGLALVAIVALLVWLMARRSQRAAAGSGVTATEALQHADAAWALVEAVGHADRASPRSRAQAEPEPDPVAHSISEAELCLAYGQYGVAEDILQRLVDSQPHVVEHRLRLLRVLHAARKPQAFLEQAQVLRTQVTGSVSDAWCEAAELGRELLPNSPLFHETPASGDDQGPEDTLHTDAVADGAPAAAFDPSERASPPAGIDTENLDFPVYGGGAPPETDDTEAAAPPALDLDIGSAEAESRSPAQADLDLTNELLAWDPAEPNAEETAGARQAGGTAASAPAEKSADHPQPTAEDETPTSAPEDIGELDIWDELTNAPGDKAEEPQAPEQRVAETGDESESGAIREDVGAGPAHPSTNGGPAAGVDSGTEGQAAADEDEPGLASRVRSATARKE